MVKSYIKINHSRVFAVYFVSGLFIWSKIFPGKYKKVLPNPITGVKSFGFRVPNSEIEVRNPGIGLQQYKIGVKSSEVRVPNSGIRVPKSEFGVKNPEVRVLNSI
jgi:hypothetical protein